MTTNKKTKKTKKTVKKTKLTPEKALVVVKSKFTRNLALVILIGTASFFLAKRYKSQFIVSTVNRHPISRFQLNSLLNERYGQAILDELVTQTLIKDLLKENSIEITEADIEEEISNLKLELGGDEVFEATLAQYGLTLEKLKERLQITLGQKKLASTLFSPEVTDEEVSDYFTQNAASFEGRTLPELEAEIKLNLLDQKLQLEFNTWFEEQKETASIRTFI